MLLFAKNNTKLRTYTAIQAICELPNPFSQCGHLQCRHDFSRSNFHPPPPPCEGTSLLAIERAVVSRTVKIHVFCAHSWTVAQESRVYAVQEVILFLDFKDHTDSGSKLFRNVRNDLAILISTLQFKSGDSHSNVVGDLNLLGYDDRRIALIGVIRTWKWMQQAPTKRRCLPNNRMPHPEDLYLQQHGREHVTSQIRASSCKYVLLLAFEHRTLRLVLLKKRNTVLSTATGWLQTATVPPGVYQWK